jgi:hypothetical protein
VAENILCRFVESKKCCKRPVTLGKENSKMLKRNAVEEHCNNIYLRGACFTAAPVHKPVHFPWKNPQLLRPKAPILLENRITCVLDFIGCT